MIRHTGFGISIWAPVAVSKPVILFLLKITTLLVSWFATSRKCPVGSMIKFLGFTPMVDWYP